MEKVASWRARTGVPWPEYSRVTWASEMTAHYIAERLQESGKTISGLAQGMPIGGELDYMDDGTLSTALKSRKVV